MKKIFVFFLLLILVTVVLRGQGGGSSVSRRGQGDGSPVPLEGTGEPSPCPLGFSQLTVNGVSIAFEIAGEGPPVILLHGNGGSHKDLSLINSVLVQAGYRVYAIDSRGQGANEPLSEYHYADMADDVYELIRIWDLDHPALYGWSDGGIVGLLTEIRHPGTLGLLAVSGANIRPDGLRDSFLLPVRLANAVRQDPLTAMIVSEPQISEEELASIRIPVLVTAGEDDIIKENHTRQIARSIPDSELMIMEGENHGSYITGNSKMADALLSFLSNHGDMGGE